MRHVFEKKQIFCCISGSPSCHDYAILKKRTVSVSLVSMFMKCTVFSSAAAERSVFLSVIARSHEMYNFCLHPQKRCVKGRPRIFRFHLRLWCITGRSPPNISNTSTSSAYICRDPFKPCPYRQLAGSLFSPAQDQALALAVANLTIPAFLLE